MTDHQPKPDVPTGWPVEPPFVSPFPARPDQPQYPAQYGGQPQQITVHHYYAAPARRGPDVRQALGWTAVGGIVTAALLAVATVAVALGLAAVALSIMALVVRGLWRDMRGGR